MYTKYLKVGLMLNLKSRNCCVWNAGLFIAKKTSARVNQAFFRNKTQCCSQNKKHRHGQITNTFNVFFHAYRVSKDHAMRASTISLLSKVVGEKGNFSKKGKLLTVREKGNFNKKGKLQNVRQSKNLRYVHSVGACR